MTRPPAGTSDTGRRLWRAVLAECELDEHVLTLLHEAVRTVTLLGELIDTGKGPRRAGSLSSVQ